MIQQLIDGQVSGNFPADLWSRFLRIEDLKNANRDSEMEFVDRYHNSFKLALDIRMPNHDLLFLSKFYFEYCYGVDCCPVGFVRL